jgi:hypothetical protein
MFMQIEMVELITHMHVSAYPIERVDISQTMHEAAAVAIKRTFLLPNSKSYSQQSIATLNFAITSLARCTFFLSRCDMCHKLLELIFLILSRN